MAAKRGQKRKVSDSEANTVSNGTVANSKVPDRNTWPGWVEMESEPAFFNVMLKEMGVQGVRIQEVYAMDELSLATLPQPVHALIFLYRYRTQDQERQSDEAATNHIWFANQIPDFACASVALLNIVNNIPGLHMGKELRDFKDFTNDMDPITRGDMIDNFTFVKRIHNSFASDNDLMQADMHLKEKMDKQKKKAAAAKGRATKEANKAAQEKALQEKSANAGTTTKSGRTTIRSRKAEEDAALLPEEPPPPTKPRRRSTRSNSGADDDQEEAGPTAKPRRRPTRSSSAVEDDPDGDFDPSAANRKVKAKSPGQANGVEEEGPKVRRSGRESKPRKDIWSVKAEETAEEGFHFIAYMPIRDHVWKLDGLDSYPTDVGSFGEGGNGADGGTGNWLDAASPAIMGRMEQFAGAEIEFNLMAVVHDSARAESTDLLQNVKVLQAVDAKLTAIVEDWEEMDGAETKADVIRGTSADYNITQADIEGAEIPVEEAEKIEAVGEDLLELIEFRKKVITRQEVLREGLTGGLYDSKEDEEKARYRRHDYSNFIRSWLGELAEKEVLGDLVDG